MDLKSALKKAFATEKEKPLSAGRDTLKPVLPIHDFVKYEMRLDPQHPVAKAYLER